MCKSSTSCITGAGAQNASQRELCNKTEDRTPLKTIFPFLRDRRYRRAGATTLAAAASKCLVILSGIVSVPMLLNHLDASGFGVWATIVSIQSFLILADFGVGQELTVLIARGAGAGNLSTIRGAIQDGTSTLLLLALVVAGVGVMTLVLLRTHTFGINGETAAAVFASIIVFSITLPLTVAQRINDGFQRGYINHAWQSIGSILGIFFLFIAISLRMPLWTLVISTPFAQAIAMLCNYQFLFRREHPEFKPEFRLGISGQLLKSGVLFTSLNVLTVCAVQSDALVIARMLGAEAVAELSVVQRLSQVAFLYWAFTAALWPSYADAIGSGETQWISRTFRRSLIASVLFGVLSISLMVFVGPFIVLNWLGGAIFPRESLYLAFGVYILVNSVVGSLAALMNAAGILKEQLCVLLLLTPVCIVMKVALAMHFSSSGPVWATNICYAVIYCVFGVAVINKKILNRNRERLAM